MLTKPLSSRRGYRHKEHNSWSESRSQLITVQSRRSRLKPIHHLPEQRLPEEDGRTFAVSQSFTVRRQQRCWEAETNKFGISRYFYVHLFVQKKDLQREYITYNNKNTSAYNFMFLARGVQEVITYSISVLLLLICILHLIRKKSSLCIGCGIITRSMPSI